MPEVTYEALEKYGRDLVADARTGRLPTRDILSEYA